MYSVHTTVLPIISSDNFNIEYTWHYENLSSSTFHRNEIWTYLSKQMLVNVSCDVGVVDSIIYFRVYKEITLNTVCGRWHNTNLSKFSVYAYVILIKLKLFILIIIYLYKVSALVNNNNTHCVKIQGYKPGTTIFKNA